jgi:hypothetical protein
MKRPIFCLALCLLCGTFLGFSSLGFSSNTAHASGSASNILFGIAAVNKNDVWAAGESATAIGSQTLLEHWNGYAWSVIPGPKLTGNLYGVFEGIAAGSSKNVWAVGSFLSQGGNGQTLIEHWNGHAWKVIPSPNPAGAISSFLNGVSITEDSVWAVGTTEDALGSIHPLIERWDDGAWSIVASPDSSLQSSNLQAVSAISKNDVWAVGNFLNDQNQEQALIEHWNGDVWEIVPDAPSVSGELNSISAIAKDDIWSVGSSYDDSGNSLPLIEHWDGNIWQEADAGALPANVSYSVLNAVSARSEDDVWAVGYAVDTNNNQQGLVEHWNGKAWEVVPTPAFTGSVQSVLQGVVAVTHSSVWTGGETIDPANGYSTHPLVENWNGRQWSVVSSPTP